MKNTIDPPKCDENNPDDPHYADRFFGNYDGECRWIWDIGRAEQMAEGVARALKGIKKQRK